MDSKTDDVELSQGETNKIQKAVDFWLDTAQKSTVTRLNFHQQLAVLAAGSIAVIASGTTAVLSLSVPRPQIVSKHFAVSVIAASIALGLSLSGCILHNFLETIILARTEKSGMRQALDEIFKIGVPKLGGMDSQNKNRLSRTLTKFQNDDEQYARSTLKLRSYQLWISWIAVAFFIAGYFALIFLVLTEAQSF